jgi:hypothetical protein
VAVELVHFVAVEAVEVLVQLVAILGLLMAIILQAVMVVLV